MCATPWHDGPPDFFKMSVEIPQVVDAVFDPLLLSHPFVDAIDLVFEIYDESQIAFEFVLRHGRTLLLDFRVVNQRLKQFTA